LRAALSTEAAVRPRNLCEAIRARIEPLGGVDLDIPPREPMPPPVEFD
jgi:antitoxin FitA